jgi:hypothetical protein
MEMWTSTYKLLIGVSMIRSRRMNIRIEERWMVEASLCCVSAGRKWSLGHLSISRQRRRRCSIIDQASGSALPITEMHICIAPQQIEHQRKTKTAKVVLLADWPCSIEHLKHPHRRACVLCVLQLLYLSVLKLVCTQIWNLRIVYIL